MDAAGEGKIDEPRMYQLIRQPAPIVTGPSQQVGGLNQSFGGGTGVAVRDLSKRKAVRPKRPKGTSTKPASVVSLNSIRLTKSWIAMTKKLAMR